jgi:hypothetical protein
MAIDEKRKRLHYERIRIQEEKSEHAETSQQVKDQEESIDNSVFEDTKDQHEEKNRIENLIDDKDDTI